MSSTDTPIEPHDAELLPQETGGKGSEELARAQRERPAEQVGAPYGHGSIRRVTSDELDPHRDWTVQSGRPFPQGDNRRTTRFHPSELPDPQKAVDAGLMPQLLPPQLVDEAHVTQPPTENVPLEHPLRQIRLDPGYEGWKQTNSTQGLEEAQAQRRLRGSWEDRNGEAGDIDPESDLPEVEPEFERVQPLVERLQRTGEAEEGVPSSADVPGVAPRDEEPGDGQGGDGQGGEATGSTLV